MNSALNESHLYSILTRFGDYYPLNLNFNVENISKELENKYQWIQYNPRKSIDRLGLSITSLDGGISGIPDLDSLYEYYNESGIILGECDFRTKTVIYPYFEKWFSPIQEYMGRTHIIKLNRGGYFPPHRDQKQLDIDSFRLFLPLNYHSQTTFFMIEDKKMEFNNGTLYFINTSKMHTLFHFANDPFYFVVANIILSKESVDTILNFLPG